MAAEFRVYLEWTELNTVFEVDPTGASNSKAYSRRQAWEYVKRARERADMNESIRLDTIEVIRRSAPNFDPEVVWSWHRV